MQGMMPVLSNCQFCQFGISFDPVRLASYSRLLRETVTASLYSEVDRNLRPGTCSYNIKTEEHMPAYTVCYHARLSADSISHGQLNGKDVQAEMKSKETAELPEPKESLTAGTGVETLYFLSEDDEYAGLPMINNN